MMPGKKLPQFTSRLSKGETAAALIYLPVHVALLPMLVTMLIVRGIINEATGNFICYAIGAVYMLVLLRHFFRRDFDALCERPLAILAEIAVSYLMMMGFNLLTTLLIGLILRAEPGNPNNEAIFMLAGEDFGKVSAMAIFLAPLLEEPMFRAGIFGTLRKYNRVAAYAVSMLAFSLYHVWGYAASDPKMFIYVIQYLPISWLLCRIYERNNTIWASTFLHMLINAISMKAVELLGEML